MTKLKKLNLDRKELMYFMAFVYLSPVPKTLARRDEYILRDIKVRTFETLATLSV